MLQRRARLTALLSLTALVAMQPPARQPNALPRHLRLIYRQAGELSHAAQQFLTVARKHEQAEPVAEPAAESVPGDEPVG